MVLESTNDLKWYLSNYICITHEVQVGPAIGPAASVTRSSKGWEFHFLLKNQRKIKVLTDTLLKNLRKIKVLTDTLLKNLRLESTLPLEMTKPCFNDVLMVRF